MGISIVAFFENFIGTGVISFVSEFFFLDLAESYGMMKGSNSSIIMKLHLPLGLLVAVLTASQASAASKELELPEKLEFDLSYTVKNTDWERVPDSITDMYHVDLPFAVYREKEWEFDLRVYKTRTNYFISSLPQSQQSTIEEKSPNFYMNISGALYISGLGAPGFGYDANPDVNESSRFQLNYRSSKGSVTTTVSAFKSANSHSTHSPKQWTLPTEDILGAPDILFTELYTSWRTAATINIRAFLDLEQNNEYVVARGGTLGAYSKGNTGLLAVWDDPQYQMSMLMLNTDCGENVEGLFQDSSNKSNTLRFAAPGRRTERAVGERISDFRDIAVQGGGGEVRTEKLYAKGIRVDEGAVGYELDVSDEVGFAGGAELTFEEDFTLTGTGTITWDGNATFDIAADKTVHWDLSGSKNPETGDAASGEGHVTIGARNEDGDYVTGGTLSVGGDYAIGTGSVDTYGSTLNMNNTVWKNQITMYSAEDTGSSLVGAGNAIEGTEVRIRALMPEVDDDRLDLESGEDVPTVAPVDFGMGGLKGEYLKSVDLGTRGGRVYGIGGGTVTVEEFEAFSFLVREENIKYVKEGEAPTGGTYMMEFQESGAIEFEDGGKIELQFADSVIEWLRDLEGEEENEDESVGTGDEGGYVDLWLTNGIFAELKDIQENGTVGDMRAWFQKYFSLEAGTDIIVGGDFVDGAEGGGGVLRFVLRANGIWYAATHGKVDAQQISGERWKQVRVNTDMTVMYSKNDDDGIVLRNLNSGTDGRSGNLTIQNQIGDEDVTLYIDQQDDVTVASRTLRGSIILDQGEAVHRIKLTKRGGAELNVTGNVENVGTLRVEKGEFTIGGNLVKAGTLSVDETEEAKEGEEEIPPNKLVLNGWQSEAETLGTIGHGSVLEVNGILTLSKDTTPIGQGTIGGKGAIVVNGTLNASDVGLAGVVVVLEGDNAGLVTSSQSNKVGALSVAEGKEASLQLGGDITIDNTSSSPYFQGASTYRGSIKSANEGAKTVTVSGASTAQTLYSGGSNTVNLTVDGGAYLGLIGEKANVAPVAQQAPTTPSLTYGELEYGNVTVKEGSSLALLAPDDGKDGSVASRLKTGDFSMEKGGTLGVYYNLKPTEGKMEGVEAAVVGSGTMAWGEGAKLVLGSLGINPFDLENPQDLKDMKVLSSAQGITGLNNGQEVDHVLEGSFRVFWEDVRVTYKDGDIVVNATARRGNIFAQDAGKVENVQAGAQLMWAARTSEAMTNGSEFQNVMNWVVTGLGEPAMASAVSKTFAGVAGSTVPIAGTAQRDALRAQMLRMRDHAGAMGLDSDCSYDSLPYTHFWLEASGDFANLNDDGMMSGYKYNAWGGTVGLGMDLNERTSLGLGLSALYGDLDGGSCDTADGNMDSYYLSLMARFARRRWGHTLVGVVGLNSVDLDRTVQYGAASYTTSGSTDGWGVGLMYELTYDIPLNEEHTQVLQPLVGASVMRTTLDGYNEDGQGVGLNVGEQEWVTSTFTLGLRWISAVGASVFNTAAQLELRANIAQDVGDSQGGADVALQVNPGVRQTVEAAEVGKTAAQLGAALRMPLSEDTLLYFNVGADLRSGMDSWSVTAGAKYNF